MPPAGDLLVRRAGRVVTNAGPPLDGPAAVGVRGGVVAWVGPDEKVPRALTDAPELDAAGACVVPGFVDPHTHALWAGSRREEFAARLAGERYDGGGIATT
ncbi:MAG TPA: imidazolonepropionase, partial [Mycobacteriales bacterium]|nr:imidazolonepropionase [Mycobacteriales bacterium]